MNDLDRKAEATLAQYENGELEGDPANEATVVFEALKVLGITDCYTTDGENPCLDSKIEEYEDAVAEEVASR